ncbi:hypothetical protein Syun_003868 [Stephania yunnanensis]|uniref:Uncharacterized protein n=1 Tax=Stephania yunnanensis TaxID=152371 RepID=A0AAP0L214_9MAGN
MEDDHILITSLAAQAAVGVASNAEASELAPFRPATTSSNNVGTTTMAGAPTMTRNNYGVGLSVSHLPLPPLSQLTSASPSTVSITSHIRLSLHRLNSPLPLPPPSPSPLPLPSPSQLTFASPSTVSTHGEHLCLSLHRLNSRSQLSPSRVRQSPPSGSASPFSPSLNRPLCSSRHWICLSALIVSRSPVATIWICLSL